MMALYYISLALTAFFYAVAGILTLLAVATAVGCLVSETGRKLVERRCRRNYKSTKKHSNEDCSL